MNGTLFDTDIKSLGERKKNWIEILISPNLGNHFIYFLLKQNNNIKIKIINQNNI